MESVGWMIRKIQQHVKQHRHHPICPTPLNICRTQPSSSTYLSAIDSNLRLEEHKAHEPDHQKWTKEMLDSSNVQHPGPNILTRTSLAQIMITSSHPQLRTHKTPGIHSSHRKVWNHRNPSNLKSHIILDLEVTISDLGWAVLIFSKWEEHSVRSNPVFILLKSN